MRRMTVVMAVVALVAAGCGGGSSSSGSGQQRTVLLDYKHDEFAGSFLRFYPETVKVRQGDTVRFKQSWSGEPHSVTAGALVDAMFGYATIFEKYQSVEEALAGGETQETVDKVVSTFTRIPGMTDRDQAIYPAGAEPCYVANDADVPAFSTADDQILMGVACPTHGQPQPKFNGSQALYNSGFIPYQGSKGNTFEIPIAADAKPGTYKYFCNYHWTEMHGTIEIVPKDTTIPSQDAVGRQARKEVQRDAKAPLAEVVKAEKGDFSSAKDAKSPFAGFPAGGEAQHGSAASINEFFPAAVNATVGKPVTWTDQGSYHTISFNVPKYFPVFTVNKAGAVHWDQRSLNPVAWTVPDRPEPPPGASPDDPNPMHVDVGKWDGGGGFHSSGALEPGDTFTVTFTKPGTYLFACVLHPPMVGKVVVKA
jgi:plastocyanin